MGYPNYKPDALFRLIKALTRNEKRYFRLFISRERNRKSKKYLHLFEIIDRQKGYEKKDIRSLYEKTVRSKNLTDSKYHLHRLLLKVLHFYHSGSSVDSRLHERMHYSEILAGKGLFEDSKEEINMARKIAWKHDKYPEILNLSYRDARLLLVTGFNNVATPTIEAIEKESLSALQKLKNIFDFLSINLKVFHNSSREGPEVRNEEEMKKKYEIINHPLHKSEENAITFRARIYYYQSLGHSLDGVGKPEKSYEIYKRALAFIESSEKWSKEVIGDYTSVLFNLIIQCIALRKYEEVIIYIQISKSIPDRFPRKYISESLHTRILSNSYMCELQMYFDTGAFEKGAALNEKIEEIISRFLPHLRKHDPLVFFSLLCTCNFGAGKYAVALKYLNKVLNYPHKEIREDIRSFSRIMILILHYEMGNTGILEYAIRSTYRYLYKRGRLYKAEKIILEFIRKELMNVLPGQDLKDAFFRLKEKLEPLTRDPYEKDAFVYLDYVSWLESKITGLPFADIIREKASQKEQG